MILIVVRGTIPILNDGEGDWMVKLMLLKTRKLQKKNQKIFQLKFISSTILK